MAVSFMKDPLPVINQGERHIPAVLLVDISSSMDGEPIDELNRGLIEFGVALHEDELALGRADVSIISFNSNVHTEIGFRPAVDYQAPHLYAGGSTSLNHAIEEGIKAIEARKEDYRAQGISYYRPWLFVLTDGAPTDLLWEERATRKLRKAIMDKKLTYLPMGIGPYADIVKLQSYYPENAKAKPVLKADAKNFKEAFVWLSNSIGVISNSDPLIDNEVALPPTPAQITVGI